ncbi:hypothetical protein JXA32_16405 [Candidatus Sumerlaeota bacterium]|nr:hypothetical protein [Candidatus Sumerlaeota bacterium]
MTLFKHKDALKGAAMLFVALCAATAWPQSGQQMEIMGKSFNLMNHSADGRQESRVKEGQLEYLQSVGDVELHQGEELTLYCHHLEYFADKGQLIALRWEDKPVKALQSGTTAYADKLVYMVEASRIELYGKASVISEDAEQVREIYGETIIRVIDEQSGETTIRVLDQPVMINKPSGDAAQRRPLEESVEDDSAASANVAGTLGDSFTLKADPENGQFDIKTGPLGEILKFTALRNVSLRSEKMDIDCHQLDLIDDGAEFIAVGNPVLLRQGDVRADCHRFRHFVENNQSVLTGFPAPRIHQKEDGRIVTSTAPVIRIMEGESGETTIDWLVDESGFAQKGKRPTLPQIQFRDQVETQHDEAEGQRVMKLESMALR